MFLKSSKIFSDKSGQNSLSIITEGIEFSGEINTDGDIHIDGNMKGTIKAHEVVIGPNGNFDGEIISEVLKVSGLIKGKFTIKNLFIKKDGLLQGKAKNYSMPATKGNDEIRDMEPTKFYQTIGIPIKDAGADLPYFKYLDSDEIKNLSNLSESLTMSARHALLQMINYIVLEYGLTREQAYILCSVAVDLRVGQVVDVPNYVITAVLNLDVFDKNRN